MNYQFSLPVNGQGLYDITPEVKSYVEKAGVAEGLATVFIQHTSASVLIQENADPAVLTDLGNWLDRLVPENDPLYTHTEEGPDDMPAHIKGALTAVNFNWFYVFVAHVVSFYIMAFVVRLLPETERWSRLEMTRSAGAMAITLAGVSYA